MTVGSSCSAIDPPLHKNFMHCCIPSPQPEFESMVFIHKFQQLLKGKSLKKREVELKIIKGSKAYSRISVEIFAVKF